MIVEQFPVGMRVLAVDDDPICLKLLETLLHKCRYHVTTTSQAIKALKLLRENKNKFDLVISDVHMPDMDGFKLLELVGLEMDLPVIMLSANGDTKLVMKGITHGACDYLLKPVRIEELKNIWQHVVRRRKVDPKDQNNSDKFYTENEGVQTLAVTGESDEDCKLIRKRKDQNEDDNEDRESGPNNKDSSTQKKPRVVWTGDLHRKFVAAVRELGVEEAVPKKILDLMNVEKLTRENVASHLQKYRSYLKRIASQEAHVVAALGGPDSAYLRLTSPNGFGDLQNLTGSPQFQSAAIRPFSSEGMLGTLSAPAGLTMHTHSSSGTIQLCQAGNLNNPIKNRCKFQPVIIPGNQNGNILQGMPTSFEVDQPELNKGVNCSQHLSIANNNSSVFCISGNFPDGNINQSCGTMTSSNMEFASHLPDFARCTDGGSAIQPNSLSSWDYLKTAIPGDRGNSMSSISSNSCNISSVNTISAGISDLRADSSQNLGFEENNLTAYQNPNLVCNSMISSHGVLGPMTPYNNSLDHKNTGFSKYNDINVGERECLVDPLIMKHNEVEQSALQTTVFLKRGYLVDQTNSLDGYSYNNVGSLEDLVHAMMKQD